MGSHEGIIDQGVATITFTIPEYLLQDGRYEGVIAELEVDGDEANFWLSDSESIYVQGDSVGFGTGDVVYVDGGEEGYTIVIEVIY